MPAKQRTAKVNRNPDLIRGVGKYSRSQMYHKRGLWAIKAKNGGVFPRHDAKSKVDAPVEKPPKFYPAEDVKKPLPNRRTAKPAKLRASITPGTVLIILAGRFKGKRVVFLKQLASGLLLVTGEFYANLLSLFATFFIRNAERPFTKLAFCILYKVDIPVLLLTLGPFKINGVPLRRVNQAYVIGTSTKVDISGVTLDKFDDKYFGKVAEKKKKKTEGEFFEAEKEVSQTFFLSFSKSHLVLIL